HQQNEKKLAEDKLFISLKRHIIKEREHKKQLEAETAKEEQLRNEREMKLKQDKQTLGKTQQEIAQVEEQLIQLKNKKHQLFLQLKALITKEVHMEKMRKESDIAMNVRNDVGPPYAPYGPNDKGIKRGRSPVPQADYYKHAGQSQGIYLPSKNNETGRHETRRAVLWCNPAKYGTSPHQGWPMTSNIVNNRYPLPQTVPAPHILHLNSEHQQPPPPQLKQAQSAPTPTQKTGSISIEKIGDNMRSKITPQQQDFTIHRRIGNVNPPNQTQQEAEFQNGPYHGNLLR
ncbi:CLUMA_CG021310, isoform A, partial [Clunio marinus]